MTTLGEIRAEILARCAEWEAKTTFAQEQFERAVAELAGHDRAAALFSPVEAPLKVRAPPPRHRRARARAVDRRAADRRGAGEGHRDLPRPGAGRTRPDGCAPRRRGGLDP